MLVDVAVTHLEMNSPDKLIAGRIPDADVTTSLVMLDEDWSELRDVYQRIGVSQGWRNSTWSEEQWQDWHARPNRYRHLIRVDGHANGLIDIEPQDDGNVEICVFGLTSEYTARGIGGHALTLATKLAWQVAGRANSRVWLHTSTRDHERALPNYLARGFRVFKIEHETREVPTPAN